MDRLEYTKLPFKLETLPEGWFSKAKVNCLFQLASLTPGPILEVGSWVGRSTCVICYALKHRSESIPFHAVDMGFSSEEEWKKFFGVELSERHNAELYKRYILQPGGSIVSLCRNLGERGLMHLVRIHKGDILDFAFKEKFALIFADVTHDRMEIDRNLTALLPLLKSGGILACDDITEELAEHLTKRFPFKWWHVDSLLFYGEPSDTAGGRT